MRLNEAKNMLLNKDKIITMMSDEVFKSVLQDGSCEDYLVDMRVLHESN